MLLYLKRFMKEKNPATPPKINETSSSFEPDQENLIQIQTDFLTDNSNHLNIPVEPGIFQRVTKKLEDKNLSPVHMGKAVAFVVVGATAVGIAAKLISRKKEKQQEQEILLLTDEQQTEYNQMYETSFPKILSYLHFKGCPDQEAEDLTQVVFFRALRKFPEFIPNEKYDNPYIGWLYKIAENTWKNEIRNVNRRKRKAQQTSLEKYKEDYGDLPIFADQNMSVEAAIEINEDARVIGEAVARLHAYPYYQLVIWLKNFTPLTNKEIAEIIYDDEKMEGAVKSRYSRAMDKLGKEVQKLERSRESGLLNLSQ